MFTIRKLIVYVLKLFYKFFLKKKKSVYLNPSTSLDFKSRFAGHNVIGPNSKIFKSDIGFGSYIGSDCDIKRTKIGNYTCIASNVNIIGGNHPTKKFVSIHPLFYSNTNNTLKKLNWTLVKENKFKEHEFSSDNFFVKIGSDVWLGEGVSILNGVTIGDGAIVGANSFVNKNVPPYTIYGGTPAKLIKKRFKDEEIEFLLKNRWWNKDYEWIKKNYKLFDDIQKFISRNKNEVK